MFKAAVGTVVGFLALVSGSSVFAQDQQGKAIEESLDLTQKGYQDAQTGLKVEERRYENRLDGVTIEREGSRLQDYYDLSDPDIERREGGIVEGGAMRTWRFRGGR